MANWANTSYVIEGPPNLIKRFKKELDQAIEELKEGTSEAFILTQLSSEYKNVYGRHLRGFVEEPPLIKEDTKGMWTLHFYANEAWGVTDFYKELERLYPDVKVYWQVEETEYGVFATNDSEGKYFTDRWIIEYQIGDACGFKYYSKDWSKKKICEKILPTITEGKVTTEKELEEYIQSLSAEEYLSILECKIV